MTSILIVCVVVAFAGITLYVLRAGERDRAILTKLLTETLAAGDQTSARLLAITSELLTAQAATLATTAESVGQAVSRSIAAQYPAPDNPPADTPRNLAERIIAAGGEYPVPDTSDPTDLDPAVGVWSPLMDRQFAVMADGDEKWPFGIEGVG